FPGGMLTFRSTCWSIQKIPICSRPSLTMPRRPMWASGICSLISKTRSFPARRTSLKTCRRGSRLPWRSSCRPFPTRLRIQSRNCGWERSGLRLITRESIELVKKVSIRWSWP
ncbi:hypothetical protein LPJCHP_LPJCHP_11400, partial [Dysosmobacter welbionis]